MARFEMELPTDVIKDVNYINANFEKIFGGMTQAGAEAVAQKMRANAPAKIKPFIKITRTYKTPSDNGINTKAYVSGYLPFKGNRTEFTRRGRAGGNIYAGRKGIPVAFLAILYEYGRSTAPFPKRPFLRKSFNKGEIEKVMLEKQKSLSGGLLDE